MILLPIALELWAFLFFGFFGSELLGTYPALRITAHVLFVAPLLVWAAMRLRGPLTRLHWAILLALGIMAVVSLASADRQGSLESLGLAFAYALAFFALRDIGSRQRLRTAIAIAISYAFLGWMVLVSAWWIAGEGRPGSLRSAPFPTWNRTRSSSGERRTPSRSCRSSWWGSWDGCRGARPDGC